MIFGIEWLAYYVLLKQIQGLMLRLKSLLNYKFGLISAAVLFFLGFLAGNYWFGQIHASRPSTEVLELRTQNRELKLDSTKIKTLLDIEQNTVIEMNNTLLQQQSELVEQQLALRFYQKVMAPEQTANGVRLEEVNIEAGVSPNYYRFEVLVAQLEKRKNYIRGEIQLLAIGSAQGQPKSINLKNFLTSEHDLKFSFRYFQSIKGEFSLPSEFIPEQLQVSLKMLRRRGQKAATVSQLYPWEDIVEVPLKPLNNDGD